MKLVWFIVIFGSLLLIGVTLGFVSCQAPEDSVTDTSEGIDKRSFDLGMIQAFAEMVAAEVKTLALSPPLLPEEVDRLIEDARKIAEAQGVSLYLEKDFLTTDLFSAEVTEGKQVLLIYLDPVKDEYMKLKADKSRLVESGQYTGEARAEIGRRMGRLLSYSEDRIEVMLAQKGATLSMPDDLKD